MTSYHEPVLVQRIMGEAQGARRIVDGTVGDGGHAAALLEMPDVEVLGVDRDPAAIAIAGARLGQRAQLIRASYSDPEALEAIRAFKPDFILLDLGVSSRQFDDEGRGFTFRPGSPLDMRMGDVGTKADDLLNDASVEELQRILADYADERRARRMAVEIDRRRQREAFTTSDDLVNAIRAVLGPRSGPADFARIFQALRIAVNDELAGLAVALPAMRDSLSPGGRFAVISYHSGEDRIVKQAFHSWARSCICPPGLPVCTCRGAALGWAVPRKPIVPEPAEIAANPRARSAKLRIFQVMGNEA